MVAAGVVVLSGAIYLGSRLWAQPGAAPGQPAPQAPAAAEPHTRIALLNLSYVVKNYDKFKAFQAEMKNSLQTFQDRDKAKAAQIEAINKELAKGEAVPAPQREAYMKQLKQVEREKEDNSNDARNFLGKKSDEQMVILYREVQDTAQRYAVAHNFELVLHYNDAIDPNEYWSPANVMRKMQAGACMPLYYTPGMEISQQVVLALNANYKRVAPAAAAPAAPAAGQPAAPAAPAAQPPH
jgi:Skp family chaperone for outer membrane proteins